MSELEIAGTIIAVAALGVAIWAIKEGRDSAKRIELLSAAGLKQSQLGKDVTVTARSFKDEISYDYKATIKPEVADVVDNLAGAQNSEKKDTLKQE